MGTFSRVQTHPEYFRQTQVYITLFAIFLKSFFLFFFHWQNSANNDPVLLFKLHLRTEIVFCRLLQLTDGRGGHGFKLEKVGPTFSTFNVRQKNSKVGAPWWNLFNIDFITLQNFYRNILCSGRGTKYNVFSKDT